MAAPTSVHLGLLLLCLLHLAHTSSRYRLCASRGVDSVTRCQTLKTSSESLVECVHVTDSVDCSLKLQEGLADFGVFTAEQAILASHFIDESVNVIADLRHSERSNDLDAFQAVAVVKSTYGGTLGGLKGSNFCHPGFSHGQLWTDSVLKHFERTVVDAAPCDENLSVAEREIKALSSFFNSTCRPGPWVQDDKFDSRLKMNYSNLCELCDSPKTCSYASHETDSHRAALNCLIHRGGNISYTALRHVREYFGLENGSSPRADINEYKFLCPDGTTAPLDTASPCAWVKQPWSLVLARKVNETTLQPLLASWLDRANNPVPAWQEALSGLILENDHIFKRIIAPLTVFTRESGEMQQTCGDSVKWCSSSESEARKCKWLSAAAQTHGLRPAVNCVTADSTWGCWAKVQDGTASVVTVDTEYGYIARKGDNKSVFHFIIAMPNTISEYKSYDLSPFAYFDGEVSGNYQVLAVVSNSNHQIKNWSDVRQKKACFPEFGGLAWVSMVSALVDNGQVAPTCSYAQEVGSYLSGACAPGATDPKHTRGSGVVPANLCSVCGAHNNSDICTTSPSSVFYGDIGALRCLSSGSGDIAFVDYSRLTSRGGTLDGDIVASGYRVLCRNGSLSLSAGLTVGIDCALAYGVGSEIMARSDRNKARNLELTELLLEMDKWFGATTSRMGSVFHMYSEFQGNKDLLFKDSTRGVVLADDTGYLYVNSYKKLQEQNSVCVSAAMFVLPSILVLLAVFLAPFIF